MKMLSSAKARQASAAPQAVKVRIPYKSIRRIENPLVEGAEGIRTYEGIVAIRDLPEVLADWRHVNPRDPRTTGAVVDAITEGLLYDEPRRFSAKNRGLYLLVKEAFVNNESMVVTLTLDDHEIHGIGDGGTTYEAIRRNIDEVLALDFEQLVKVEIVSRVTEEKEDLVVSLVEARNTSNQVKDKSILDAKGVFDPIKKALRDKSGIVAYSELELDDDGHRCPINVEDIIGMLTAMDIDHFNGDPQPIVAYTSKQKAIAHYKANVNGSLKPILPILPGIVGLWEHIQKQLPTVYNGHLGGLSCVRKIPKVRNHIQLHMIGDTVGYAIPVAMRWPVFAAMRALLVRDGNRMTWVCDPVAAFTTGGLGKILADKIVASLKEHKSIDAVAKKTTVWANLYDAASLWVMRYQQKHGGATRVTVAPIPSALMQTVSRVHVTAPVTKKPPKA